MLACSSPQVHIVYFVSRMLSIVLRPTLMNVFRLFVVCFVVLRVSDPYTIPCFTLELKMHILVLIELCFELQIFLNMLNTTLAFLILCFISAYVPPVVFIPGVFAPLGVRPSFLAASESLSVFSCIYMCVCVWKEMSRSSSCSHILHWIPFLFPSVVSIIRFHSGPLGAMVLSCLSCQTLFQSRWSWCTGTCCIQ